jgi:pimeloyl-ACP methyl ester carboxylesterase
LSNADDFGMQTPAFAERYRVILPERRGHGHTADTDAALTYDGMADETIAFMEAIGTGPAHLFGWSDGGNVALIVALRRPDLVKKFAVTGTGFNTDCYVDGFEAYFAADADAANMLRDEWLERSPDPPEHYEVVLEKTRSMWFGDWALTPDELARITAPALVMGGDDDAVRLEQILAMYEAIPNAQLAVIPGASHMAPVEKPDLMNGLVLEFLASGPPQELLPFRRQGPPAPVGN